MSGFPQPSSGSIVLGGDTIGPSASNTVARLRNRPLAATAPNAAEVVTWDGATWKPAAIPAVAAALLKESGAAAKISALPGAGALAGTELAVVVQAGADVQTTLAAIIAAGVAPALLMESGAATKISALPAAAALVGTEPLAVVQTGADVQATAQDVANLAPIPPSGFPVGPFDDLTYTSVVDLPVPGTMEAKVSDDATGNLFGKLIDQLDQPTDAVNTALIGRTVGGAAASVGVSLIDQDAGAGVVATGNGASGSSALILAGGPSAVNASLAIGLGARAVSIVEDIVGESIVATATDGTTSTVITVTPNLPDGLSGALPDGSALGIVHKQTAHLTGADLPTLFTVPVQIIPTPGPNRCINVVNVFEEFVPGLVAYNFAGNQVSGSLIYLGDPSGNLLWVVTDAIRPPSFPQPTVITADYANQTQGTNASTFAGPDAIDTPVSVSAVADATVTGPVVTATIAAGGLGYATNDTGTITTLGGTAATYLVTQVDNGVPLGPGVVTMFNVVTGGDPVYDTASNPVATATGGGQPGLGLGFTVNVTAIPPPDGDLYVTVYYTIEATH